MTRGSFQTAKAEKSPVAGHRDCTKLLYGMAHRHAAAFCPADYCAASTSALSSGTINRWNSRSAWP